MYSTVLLVSGLKEDIIRKTSVSFPKWSIDVLCNLTLLPSATWGLFTESFALAIKVEGKERVNRKVTASSMCKKVF